jgi:flavin reductase
VSEDAPVLRQLRPRGTPTPEVLRAVLGQFATGVTILTAGHGATCHGMTANAFTSVSLEPPMVLCCVAHKARIHDVIRSAGAFAVSILGADQQELARQFADTRRPIGHEHFDPAHWRAGEVTGVPVATGALAWLECELTETHAGGDHSIFLGTVLNAQRRADAPESALLFYGGGFHRLDKFHRLEKSA